MLGLGHDTDPGHVIDQNHEIVDATDHVTIGETGIGPGIDLGKEVVTVGIETEDEIGAGQKTGGTEGKGAIQGVETVEIEVEAWKKAKLTGTVRNLMMILYQER